MLSKIIIIKNKPEMLRYGRFRILPSSLLCKMYLNSLIDLDLKTQSQYFSHVGTPPRKRKIEKKKRIN